MHAARISLSGFTSVISVNAPRTAILCMAEGTEMSLLGEEFRHRHHAGPGVALLGGLLARLGFPAHARMEWGNDEAAAILRDTAAAGSPLLQVHPSNTPNRRTPSCHIASWQDFSVSEVSSHQGSAFAAEDFPGSEPRSRMVGVWCYPHWLLSGEATAEDMFQARMASTAESGTTQLLILGPPFANRRNGEPWQPWLVRLLPFTEILCAQADDLVALLDEDSTRQWKEDGRLHDLPSWLTGGILHHLSSFLLSCGVGCVVLGLRDDGLYLRTNADSNHVAFVRKFAPDDQVAAHLASWTDREILIPPFAVEPRNRYAATDALAAGVLGSLVRGLTPEDTVRMAAAVVGFAAEAEDPMQVLDSWDVIQARVDGGWQQGHCRIDLTGWSDD